jgi:hypothetical protein
MGDLTRPCACTPAPVLGSTELGYEDLIDGRERLNSVAMVTRERETWRRVDRSSRLQDELHGRDL